VLRRKVHPMNKPVACKPRRSLWPFVVGVVVCGGLVLLQAGIEAVRAPFSMYAILLAGLTIVSGRFAIKMPGRSASVSVSEVFVFVSVLLFGPAAATLTVALDGLIVSLMHRDRRLYRALFNIAEPAVTTWIAGSVFFLVKDGVQAAGGSYPMLLGAVAMTACYFASNSVLTAVAVAHESGLSAFELWREHALYLAINYYAGASLAVLGVEHVDHAVGFNLEVIGLVVPLLILSYVAYKTASDRVADAQLHVREVEHLYRSTVETLAIAVDAKDQVTHGHIRRVQRHTLALARVLGVTDERELKALEAASLLHDVGKLAIPDYVLNKPGALTAAEYETMKRHANIGATILDTVEFPYPVVPVVRHHHENWNGTGYPDRLSGRNIPLGARILSVVDCFDAVTSDRPYRRRLTDEQGIEILRQRRGTMYDPEVVEAFIRTLPELRRDDALADAQHQFNIIAVADQKPRGNAHDGRLNVLWTVAPAVADRLNAAAPASDACVFAIDSHHDALVPVFNTPALKEAVEALGLRLGQGLSGWVAANRHTIVNSDPRLDFGDAAAGLGLRACLSTPVFALGTVVGVLSVYTARPGGFSDDDVHGVGAIAQELALEFTAAQQETPVVKTPTLAQPARVWVN
jgi:putative nucleotidyltransferase with HDIG domain